MSFEMELAREKSLGRMAGILLTSISILTVAVLSVAPYVCSVFQNHAFGLVIVTGCLGILFMVLITSFLLALLSQVRFHYYALPSPSSIRATLNSSTELSESGSVATMCRTLNEIYQSKDIANTKMRKLLSASMWLLVVSIGLVFLFGIVMYVLALAWHLL